MPFASSGVVLGENSLFHAIGEIFHPIFVLFANILAFIYGVIPNYAIAIVVLTLLVMAVLTPLTVKSTKSMLAMQELQPEIKKLQQKYKGAENREQLNQELMKLYKEKGINPAGGCLPFIIQFPFLIVLYDVIRGLSATTSGPHPQPRPEYISHSSRLYQDLVHSGGHMVSFGMDLSLKPFSHHASIAGYIPYFVFILVAIGLGYFQMAQMTRRNPQAAQANKQMQTMQKFMPILFAYIYLLVPAAVTLYMIVSTIIRIITQDIIFRTGIVRPAGTERRLPAGKASAPARQGTVLSGARGLLSAFGASGKVEVDRADGGGEQALAKGETTGHDGAEGNGAAAPRRVASAQQPTVTPRRPGTPRGGDRRRGGAGRPDVLRTQAKSHPRSKSKRARKAR